jgi:hypothetical protein
MNRRAAIQRASAILGYAITGPALAGVLNGCKASPDLPFKPVFFSNEQASVISTLTEIIIPRTDTPGAIDAGVPMFIDQMLANVYSPEAQQSFLTALNNFNEGAKKDFGNTFNDCSDEEKLRYFDQEHKEALTGATSSYSSGFWNAAVKQSKPFIVEVKELTLLGFFTSEPGATQVLQYNQVPGPYKGCVPLTTVGKTWAT